MKLKNTPIAILIALFYFGTIPFRAAAEDWVHPAMRNQYPGYQKLEDRKANSPDWRYATNRPQGNIHGGGTVQYRDYQPVSRAPSQAKAVTYRRPFRTSGNGANGCNCPASSFSFSNER